MKGIVFTAIWCLILLAAGYDGYFAWQNQPHFVNWEMNPFACWLARSCCLEAVVVFKAVGMLFAATMAFLCRRQRNRLALLLTAIVGCCYFLLSVHYLVEFISEPPNAWEVAFAKRLG
jgi:hypothetical protein